MKKRTKAAGKYQRRYAHKGILMYRERKHPIEVPAGALVEILNETRDGRLCQTKEGYVVEIPNAVLGFKDTVKTKGAAVKSTKPAKKASKKGSRKPKPATTPVETTNPVEVVDVTEQTNTQIETEAQTQTQIETVQTDATAPAVDTAPAVAEAQAAPAVA